MSEDVIDETLVSTSGYSEFSTALLINFLIGLASITAICIFRRRMIYFFDPRRSDHVRNPGYIKGSTYLERPPRQSDSFFGWILQTLHVPESAILRSCGPDAVFALRFMLRMAMYLTIYAIFAFVVLIPIHFAASREEEGINVGFHALSILAIHDGDPVMWCHLVFVYVFSALLFKLLHFTWLEVLDLKANWLSNEQLLGHKLTVFVTQLPPRFSTSASLYALFAECYPGQVAGAYVVQDNPRLNELYSLRQDAVAKLNDARGSIEIQSAKMAGKEHFTEEGQTLSCKVERPIVKTKFYGGEEVDLFDYYEEKLREYDAEIGGILKTIKNKQYHASTSEPGDNIPNQRPTGDGDDSDKNSLLRQPPDPKNDSNTSSRSGFVTFHSAVTASSVLNVPITDNVREFNVEIAPEPPDISWFGVKRTPLYKSIVGYIMNVAHVILVIGWVFPIAFLAWISALISQRETVTSNGFEKLILQGLVALIPSLSSILFMVAIPQLLYLLGFLKGLESRSKIAMWVFRKYFVFQLFNFFFVTAISTAVSQELVEKGLLSVRSAASIMQLLASGLPRSALTFVNYIIMRALYTNIFAMLDIYDIIVNFLLGLFANTPSATVSSLAPSDEKYYKNLPESALILIICFTFGTIQPIILIFGAFYFFTLFFAKRYTLLWISVNLYQTGCGFWPLLFNRIMFGAIIGQLSIVGIFALKFQPWPATAMIPLILITLWFWYRFSNLFSSTEHRLTLTTARFTDFAIGTMNAAQIKSLDGYDLPVGPVTFSILPFVMTDIFADTPSRSSALKDNGIVDLSTKPDFSLYSTLIPPHHDVMSSTLDKHVPLPCDFTQLPRQYHGDDPTLNSAMKSWLLRHDTTNQLPYQFLITSFLPRKWSFKYFQDAMLQSKTAQINANYSDHYQDSDNTPSSSTNIKLVDNSSIVDDSIDSENENVDEVFELPIEQKILLAQQMIRYEHSEQFKLLLDAEKFTYPNNTGQTVVKEEEEEEEENQQQQQQQQTDAVISYPESNPKSELCLHLPPFTTKDVPSYNPTFTPFTSPSSQLDHTQGLCRQRSLVDLSPITAATSGHTVNALCSYVVLPPIDTMETTMMRYFPPETNPHHYNPVYQRVWGPVYLEYLKLKAMKSAKPKAH